MDCSGHNVLSARVLFQCRHITGDAIQTEELVVTTEQIESAVLQVQPQRGQVAGGRPGGKRATFGRIGIPPGVVMRDTLDGTDFH